MLREENLFEVLHRYKPSQMNVLFVVETETVGYEASECPL